jgi:hypothetical protein
VKVDRSRSKRRWRPRPGPACEAHPGFPGIGGAGGVAVLVGAGGIAVEHGGFNRFGVGQTQLLVDIRRDRDDRIFFQLAGEEDAGREQHGRKGRVAGAGGRGRILGRGVRGGLPGQVSGRVTRLSMGHLKGLVGMLNSSKRPATLRSRRYSMWTWSENPVGTYSAPSDPPVASAMAFLIKPILQLVLLGFGQGFTRSWSSRQVSVRRMSNWAFTP